MMLPVMRSISLSSLRTIIKRNRSSRSLNQLSNNSQTTKRFFHCTRRLTINTEEKQKSVALFDAAKQRRKEKETFLDVIHTYVNEEQRKTGHVQFVYAALRYMDEYGVNEDLEIYKAILDTMPKGRYVSASLLQAEFFHYPREQQCLIDLLEKMEDNGVIPDPEMEAMIINIVGQHGFPLRKFRRMAYWMTKFKNLNPWPFPRPLPTDALELALLAIKKIATVDVQSTVTVFKSEDIKDSIDKTWIVSASSPDQEKLIAAHPKDVPIYVEGPFREWVSKMSVDYFILHADPAKPANDTIIDNDDVSNMDINLWKRARNALAHHRSIHEQDDKTIFGICATGTSSKDSLLSWIRCLQPRNPALETIPILFRFVRRVDDREKIESGLDEKDQKIADDKAEKLAS